eukprot:scaffold248686_cov23-Prasinocladus_malaysianus.AAC.1
MSAADAMRAEVRGSETTSIQRDEAGGAGGANRSAAEALRARLAGRSAPTPAKEAMALPLVDSQGRAAPGAFGRKASGADALPEGNRIPKQTQR